MTVVNKLGLTSELPWRFQTSEGREEERDTGREERKQLRRSGTHWDRWAETILRFSPVSFPSRLYSFWFFPTPRLSSLPPSSILTKCFSVCPSLHSKSVSSPLREPKVKRVEEIRREREWDGRWWLSECRYNFNIKMRYNFNNRIQPQIFFLSASLSGSLAVSLCFHEDGLDRGLIHLALLKTHTT